MCLFLLWHLNVSNYMIDKTSIKTVDFESLHNSNVIHAYSTVSLFPSFSFPSSHRSYHQIRSFNAHPLNPESVKFSNNTFDINFPQVNRLFGLLIVVRSLLILA
ncbi:hypothetical protein L1987_28680 [Smallanthus sonchifolius]|uniref:Uncharacterized protein n=1 Tax=Smallanthus sonchifolius TaxID=185202 RepID=A0ACB9HXA0_9ASTR|nr:hypothetical protein L1987_28680 [Smallanthus sonchifolius]